jgi:hypothetical protein
MMLYLGWDLTMDRVYKAFITSFASKGINVSLRFPQLTSNRKGKLWLGLKYLVATPTTMLSSAVHLAT